MTCGGTRPARASSALQASVEVRRTDPVQVASKAPTTNPRFAAQHRTRNEPNRWKSIQTRCTAHRTKSMKQRNTYLTLTTFAAAMALLEASVVIYMRRLYYPENPLDLFPLAFLSSYDPTLEFARELATIVMLVTVAMLAERTNVTRTFAAFVFLFGSWDIFYYFWLKVLLGWPRHWLEWDVLFLVPTIWLGPWISPALIALLFVVWGTAILLSAKNYNFTLWGFLTFVLGAAAGLVTFLQPAISVWMVGGMPALMSYRPANFWWWLFVPSFFAMALGLGSSFWSARHVTKNDNSPV